MINRNKKHFHLGIIIIISTFLFPKKMLSSQKNCVPFNTGLWGANVQAIAIDPDDPNFIYIGTLGGGFYYSDNSGETWIKHNSGLSCCNILCLLVKRHGNEKRIYAGTTKGIYYFKVEPNIFSDWIFFLSSLGRKCISLLKDYKCPVNPPDSRYLDAFYCVIKEEASSELWILGKNEMIRSISLGSNKYKHKKIYDLIPLLHSVDSEHNIEKLLVATDIGLLRLPGSKTDQINLVINKPTYTLAECPTEDGSIFLRHVGTKDGIFYSFDRDAQFWHQCEIEKEAQPYNKLTEQITVIEPSYHEKMIKKYAATFLSNFYIKEEDEEAHHDIWYFENNNNFSGLKVNTLAVKNTVDPDTIYAACTQGIYSRLDLGDSWSSDDFKKVCAVRVHDLFYYWNQIIDKKQLWAATDGTIFHNDLNEESWKDEFGFYSYITSIRIDSKNAFAYAGTKGNYIYRKHLYEDNWELWNTNLQDSYVTVIAIDNKNNEGLVYIGTENKGIFKRSYDENSWNKDGVNDNRINQSHITSIVIDPLREDRIFVSALNSEVFKVESGQFYPWNQAIGTTDVYSLAINESEKTLFAGSKDGCYICADLESFNWQSYTLLQDYKLLDNNIFKLQIIPTDTAFKGVLCLMITDSSNGQTRILRNLINEEFIEDETIFFEGCQFGESFCVDLEKPNVIYIGTNGAGVYKYEFEKGVQPEISKNIVIIIKEGVIGQEKGTFTITNNNSFSPIIVSFSLKDTKNFEINSKNPIVINPGDTKTIPILFKPSKYGTLKSELKIDWRDIYLNTVFKDSKTISLVGILNGGDLIINDKVDSILDLPHYKICIGTEITETLHWKKIGNVQFSSFRINGPTDTNFSLIGDWKNSLTDNDSGSLQFNFHPTERCSIIDSILIEFEYVLKDTTISKTKILKLFGMGLDAKLVLEPDCIDFFNIPLPDRSFPETFRMKNEGNIGIVIDNAFIATENSAFKFHSSSIKPDIIKAGEVGEFIKLYFKPDSLGEFNDRLIIIYHDSAFCSIDTTFVKLTGWGVEHKVDLFPIAALNFGDVHLKKLPKKDSLNITNISSMYTVWVENILLFEEKAFKILNPDSFTLQSIDNMPSQTNNKRKIYFEFFADSTQEINELLGDHIDSLFVFYRYGNPHPDSLKISAIRTDTLTGKIVSSRREVIPTEWDTCSAINVSCSKNFNLINLGNIKLYFEPLVLPQFPFTCDLKTNYINPYSDTTTSIKFYPPDRAFYFDTLEIHFWDQIFDDILNQYEVIISDTVDIPLKGQGLDIWQPIIDTLIFDQPVIWEESLLVAAKIHDQHSGINKDSTFLYYRKGGDFDFHSISLTFHGNSTYIATIPAESITSRGIEFFVEANDHSIHSAAAFSHSDSLFKYSSPPVKIIEPGITETEDRTDNGRKAFLTGGNAQQDYRLISFPLELDYPSAYEILNKSFHLNDYHHYRWCCADWQSASKSFTYINTYKKDDNFSHFIPGKSFFLLITYRYPKRYLIPQTGTTISTAQFFEYPLNIGWNFIANPFNFPIPINNIVLKENGSTNSPPEFLQYEGEWKTVQDSVLYPWRGYAIIVDNENTTLVICPNKNQKYGPTKFSNSFQKPQFQWYIPIEATCQQAKDLYNLAAVSEQAQIQFDSFDRAEPPPIGEFISLSFPHEDWETVWNEYSTDVQAPNNEGNFWDFSVVTNISKSDVNLTFNNLASVPDIFQIKLISTNLGLNLDLRKKNFYCYQPHAIQPKQTFRLVVGTADFIDSNDLGIEKLPKDFSLSKNYPNPFANSTTIHYALPQQTQLTISIFNILGELVKIVKQESGQPPGYHCVNWDGTNQQGIPVSNGLYFYQLKASNFCKTMKMILIR